MSIDLGQWLTSRLLSTVALENKSTSNSIVTINSTFESTLKRRSAVRIDSKIELTFKSTKKIRSVFPIDSKTELSFKSTPKIRSILKIETWNLGWNEKIFETNDNCTFFYFNFNIFNKNIPYIDDLR